jgi:predicted metal-dependent phosphoesterase TrpH
MLLRGALHVHTTCSDGELTIEQVIRVYESLHFDFIALTDHDYLLRSGAYDRIDDIRTNLLVFRGIEMTVFEKGYVHINRIEGETEHLYIFNHPAELGIPVERVIERIDAIQGRIPLDAIEITSHGFKTPEYDIPAIDLAKVATDDAHTRLGCGRAWIEMECRKEKDAILRAIRKGDFWNCYA